MAGLVKDKRGAVTIQVALFLPIFIIILVGAFEVWKVMYLQQVLNDAAYQGVRLLVTQAYVPPVEGQDARDMKTEAEMLIRRYVSTQAFAPILIDGEPQAQDDVYRAPYGPGLMVQIYTDGGRYPPVCGSQVRVEVARQWLVGRGSDRSSWFPFLNRMRTMTAVAQGIVQCEREEDVTGGY